jgi:hypothetical protein
MRSRQKLNFYFLLHQMELPAKGVGMMLNLFLKEQINDIIIIITVDHPFQLAAPTPHGETPSKALRPHSLASGPDLQAVSEACPP